MPYIGLGGCKLITDKGITHNQRTHIIDNFNMFNKMVHKSVHSIISILMYCCKLITNEGIKELSACHTLDLSGAN